MNISTTTKKVSCAIFGSSFIAIGIVMGSQQAQASTLFSNRTTFQNDLSTFIVDDYQNPGYLTGNISNSSNLDIYTNAALNSVVGQTKYKTTTPFGGENGYNLITGDPLGNRAYCAGCNGSFLLDFTQTTVGNTLGVFGAGFDILSGTQYFAKVTFGDNSMQDFSLAGQNFWGITSEKSIKTVHVGLQGGGSTTNGSILIDNLTIGGIKSVPEPTSVIGLLALGVGSLVKRKQQQKAAAKA
ncbi:PEP-CTERM sorting domain-containing protein [Nostoc sp. XA013]|nr:PEP-CTERM sorting domain-containing protein [Nostoc sp. XA013]